jgi:hypothetical protein
VRGPRCDTIDLLRPNSAGAAMKTFVALLLVAGTASIAGCRKVDREAAVRQRTQELIGYMAGDDLDGCIRLTDPVFVRAQGTEGVRVRFKILNALVKLGKLTPDKIRVDSIKVADDHKSAEVAMSFLSNSNDWKPLQPMKWIFTDGQWYVAF